MRGPRAPEPTKLRPVAGRIPPNRLDAEAAVVSGVILKPDNYERAASIVRPRDFYSEALGLIFSGVGELRAEGSVVDLVTVASRLKDRGRLAQIGGAAYLAKVIDETPAVHHVEAHAALVAQAARRRRVISEAQRIQAEGYGEVSDTWETDSARALQDAADALSPRGAILQAWRPLDRSLLDTPPEGQPWLLRHPTRDGRECPPGQGDGLLPLGKAGVLSSEGGAGKTYALIALAISIATGAPWFGHFHVSSEARGGRVLLGLGEESIHDFHRRLWPAVDSLGLDARQKDLVASRVVCLPLVGKPVAILGYGPDGATLVETEEMLGLRARLRDDVARCHIETHRGPRPPGPLPHCEGCAHAERYGTGWSLVVLDPLARWSGPDVEQDNTAATRFVQAVESLCEAPGQPTVLVAHHSSKTARATGKVDSRGVTAITDGFRWQGTLRSSKGSVFFAQAKSNYSIPMLEELELKRGKGGALRVPTTEEDRERQHREEDRGEERDALKQEAQERKIASSQRLILDALRRAKMPIMARDALVSLVKGNQAIKQASVSRLLASGTIFKTKEGYRIVDTPTAQEPSQHIEEEQHGLF